MICPRCGDNDDDGPGPCSCGFTGRIRRKFEPYPDGKSVMKGWKGNEEDDMGAGAKLWKKTEGGSGGKRGHSNMSHWEGTEYVKAGAKTARRFQDRQAVKDELEELRESLTGAQLREVLRDD